jgi:hypothetical protein
MITKIWEIKYIVVDGRQLTRANTTTNQQQAAVKAKRMDRRYHEREAQGKHYIIAFRGGKVKRRKNIKY